MKPFKIQNEKLESGHPLPPPVCGIALLRPWAFLIFSSSFLILLFLAPRADGADITVAKEHQIKAAFLYNFTKFIEWPPANFPDTNSPIIIGVVGEVPLCAEVAQIVKGRKVNGRELTVRPIDTPEAARHVHLLFISASEDARLPEYLDARDANILTVGESDLFALRGGAINFLVEQDKIRFDINIKVTERAGLKVSGQLQKLAKTVSTNP